MPMIGLLNISSPISSSIRKILKLDNPLSFRIIKWVQRLTLFVNANGYVRLV